MGSIQVEYFLFTMGRLQEERPAYLDTFFVHGTIPVSPGEACQLHGQCTSSADDAVVPDIQIGGTQNGCRVYPRMIKEISVFISSQAGNEFIRQRIGRRKPPLPVRCNPRSQQVTLRRVK